MGRTEKLYWFHPSQEPGFVFCIELEDVVQWQLGGDAPGAGQLAVTDAWLEQFPAMKRFFK